MFAAVDTNFLLGFASGDDDVIDAVETLKRRAPQLLISATPTPLAELRFFEKQSEDAALKSAATRALARFKRDWSFHAAVLPRAQQSRLENVADYIRSSGILPQAERHDSLILVEAALIDAKLLITDDSALRHIDYARLVFQLGEFGLHPPVLATPREIVRKFFK
jgi:hypothetical protein